MSHKTKFLKFTGDKKPDNAFLLEYQKAILLSLQEQEFMNSFQINECIKMLELQYM